MAADETNLSTDAFWASDWVKQQYNMIVLDWFSDVWLNGSYNVPCVDTNKDFIDALVEVGLLVRVTKNTISARVDHDNFCHPTALGNAVLKDMWLLRSV